MSHYLITGAAGFIGSHLAETLLNAGHSVVGLDSITDYYPAWIKRSNISHCAAYPGFTFIEEDLLTTDLSSLLSGADVVFHLAAQAGVRASWGASFQIYTNNNILATQRLLEHCKTTSPKKFVYASSSSVYGETLHLPMSEDHPVHPVSPYGVSKLAGEQLAMLYHHNYGVPAVALRFFTVYGPRQRPDMAFHKFLSALHHGKPLEIYGDGEQTRDFTYVSDVIDALIAVAHSDCNGMVFNIGGGHRVTLRHVLELLGAITGLPVKCAHSEVQKGDMRHTYADTSFAQRMFGYKPQFDLEDGLTREWLWFKQLCESSISHSV